MSQYDEHDDDKPVGKILNRRDVLKMLAGAGALFLVGCDSDGTPIPSTAAPATATTAQATTQAAATAQPTATTQAAAPTRTAQPTTAAVLPSCVARPEMTEGPYFVDERLDRFDIRPNTADGAVSEGTPLYLTFMVSQIGAACMPLPGAAVDVWHCDAFGVYSGVGGSGATDFLRGYQTTDATGQAKFTTIFPGWYPGRAVHIHFKIRTDIESDSGYEFTSQLFFEDAMADEIYKQAPYAGKGSPNVRNSSDGIYRSGGSQLLLKLTPSGDGYAATFDIGLQIA